jgi:proton glutamate symport protein
MRRLFAARSQGQWIVIGLIAGIALGVLAPDVAVRMGPLSNIFLRGVRAVMAPLIFGALITALAGTGDLRATGRLGLRTLVYFMVVTIPALVCGGGLALLLKPGQGVVLTTGSPAVAVAPIGFGAMLEQLVPSSLFDAMARGDVLQIVVFCVPLGVACAALGEPARPLVTFADALARAMFRVTNYVMWLAPPGVCAAVAVAIGRGGLGTIGALGKVVVTLYLALALFAGLVLLPLARWSRIGWRRFYQALREPFLLAVTTSSSGVALPPLLDNLERIGLEKRVTGLVLPACFCFNQIAAAIYAPIAVIFTAQAAGITLSSGQLVYLFFMLLLTTKGTPAVPRAVMVIIIGALSALHLPLEGVALLVSVEILMDPLRTGVNIVGHAVATLVLARWEGAIPLPTAPAV